MGSQLPFPNRFYAAVGFAANPPVGSRSVTDETRLLLYALYQQVSEQARPPHETSVSATPREKRESVRRGPATRVQHPARAGDPEEECTQGPMSFSFHVSPRICPASSARVR